MGIVIEGQIADTLRCIDDELHNINLNLVDLIKAVRSISENNKTKKEVNTYE